MKRYLTCAVLSGILLGQAASSMAVQVTFAQFIQQDSNNRFQWLGNGPGNLPPPSTIGVNPAFGASIPIFFQFKDPIGGLINPSIVLNANYSAFLTITGTSATPAQNLFTSANQSLQALTFSIKPAAGVQNGFAFTGAENFLTGVAIGNFVISGTTLAGLNGNAVLGGGDTLNAINFLTFTSNQILLPPGLEDSAAFSFSSVTPGYSVNNNATGPTFDDYINSFVAAGSGTFSSAVPEPGPIATLCGLGVAGSLFAFRRRRRSA